MLFRLGRYEATREIAKGGMGTVYLGRALGEGGFERLVAIKLMHAHIADNPEFEAMFLDEARLAARIRHPNVVATVDVQKANEGMFLVMDYIDGPSLQTVMRRTAERDERVPIELALRMVIDLLSGLHAAHELTGPGGKSLNLVHRDVSPHNVLIGSDGITRITDFGVARAEIRISQTKSGQLKGKLAYMAPEQGIGDSLDRRADVYAAGVVLWEVLTGVRLFKAEHEGMLIAMILEGAKKAPSEVNPKIPAAIDRVCMKALERDPEQRFASAAAFADELERVAGEAEVKIGSARAVSSYVDDFSAEQNTLPPPAGDTPLGSRPGVTPAFQGRSGQFTGGGSAVSLTQTERPSRRPLILVAAGVTAAAALAAAVMVPEWDTSAVANSVLAMVAAERGASVLAARQHEPAAKPDVAPPQPVAAPAEPSGKPAAKRGQSGARSGGRPGGRSGAGFRPTDL